MKKFFILTAFAFLPTVVSAEVVDGAAMFSPAAVGQANAKIQAMQSSSGKQLYIETVTSLNGANIDQAASQKLRERGIKGAVILISLNPKKIAVRVDQGTRDVFTRSDEEAALAAFKGGTRDAALNRMVDTCIAALSKSGGGASEPGIPRSEEKVPGDVPTEEKKSGSTVMTWLKGIGIVSAILFVLFIYIVYRIVKGIFKAVFGMFKAPQQQMPTTYQQGGQTPHTGGTYSPGPGGYAPQQSRGGGFVSTLLTGMLGAAAGSFIYDKVFGGGGSVFGAGSHDSGSSSTWDSGGSDSSSGSSSGWDSGSSGDSGSSSSWDSSDTSSSSGGDSGSSSDW